ncbi:nuclease-related domain-containing protein [Nocardiaceae bacterium NPDC056970]
MLVRVANEAGLSGAEQAVVGWIRSWQQTTPLPGLAVVNCRIPTRSGYRQVDAIVWTPYACIVLEIKGFRSPQSGTLRVPVNAAWTVGGRPAELYTHRSSTNPLDQLETNCYAVKNAIVAGGVDRVFVHGAVVVMPYSPAEITLARVGPQNRVGDLADRVELRRGIDVVVGSDTRLRHFLDSVGGPGRAVRWSASTMVSTFEALGLPDVPNADELLREGFPDDLLRVPNMATLPSAAQLPPRSMPSSMVASALAARASGPVAPPSVPAAWGPQPGPRRTPIRTGLRILKWLGVAFGVLWLAGVVLMLVNTSTTTAGVERYSSASGEVSCEIVDPGDGSAAPSATCTTIAADAGSGGVAEPCPGGSAMTVTTWTGWGPELRCGGSPAATGGRVLAPGETAVRGAISCTGQSAGIACADRSGRGFVLEGGHYRPLP